MSRPSVDYIGPVIVPYGIYGGSIGSMVDFVDSCAVVVITRRPHVRPERIPLWNLTIPTVDHLRQRLKSLRCRVNVEPDRWEDQDREADFIRLHLTLET